MSVITQNHILNIVPGMSAPIVVHVSQGDSGVELEFTLVNGDEIFDPTGTVISVHGIRQDGVGWGPVACARENGNIKFTLPDAATAVKGSGMAEINISNSTETVGTTNFAILVETATFPQGVTYANDVSVYEAILAYVDQMGEQSVANVEADLAAEIANRQAADAVLQGEINTNAHNISTNANDIATANGEIASHSSQIQTLTNNLSAETTARLNADSSEASARSSADSALSARIDTFTRLEEGSTTGDAELIDIRNGANGVVYNNAGDAVRGQINSIDTTINSIAEVTRNLFDKSAILPGTINNSGVIEDSSTLWYSDFIDVDNGPFILSFSEDPSDNYIRIAYYDNNKDFVSKEVVGTNVVYQSYVVRGNNTYKYIRLICANGFEDTLQCETGIFETTYISHLNPKDEYAREEINCFKEDISEKTRNLFNKHTIKKGNIDDSGVVTRNYDYLWYSDFINVNSGAFVISFNEQPSDSLLRIAYYDNNKEFVSREIISIAEGVYKITRTNNTYKYIKLIFAKGFEEVAQIETGMIPSEYINHTTATDMVAREVTDNLVAVSKNLFDKNTITQGIIDASGNISYDATLWYSDFIDVNNEPFIISFASLPSDNYVRVAYYDASKVFIERVANYLETDYHTICNVTKKSKYIRVICTNGFEDVLQIEKGINATDYEPHKVIIDNKTKNVLHYNVCIVGGGAAGVSAAYALIDSGLKVCLIEKESYLGGTHTQGWVNGIINGFNPKFFDEVAYEMIVRHQASLGIGERSPLSFEDSLAADWGSTHQYVNGAAYYILANPRALSLKYFEDLSSKIDVMLNTKIYKANKSGTVIESIETVDGTIIEADQFIDCSANDIILATTGGTIFYGGDSKTRYQSEYGFTEEDAADSNYSTVNLATLMFRITQGTEDLDDVTARFADFGAPILWKQDPEKIDIITFGTDLHETNEMLTLGEDALKHKLSPLMLSYWKTIKTGTSLDGKLPHNKDTYKFDGVAPLLGIREYGRARCERLLHESDLMVKITRENMASAADNLDKMIAIGNHHIDIYGDGHLDSTKAAQISANIKKYGVPYGCIVPKGYTNLLVASKAYGATHIAQSCFRLTKHMMQIGSAAGYAARIFVEDDLSDFRNVDVEKLQSESYTNLVGMVDELI